MSGQSVKPYLPLASSLSTAPLTLITAGSAQSYFSARSLISKKIQTLRKNPQSAPSHFLKGLIASHQINAQKKKCLPTTLSFAPSN